MSILAPVVRGRKGEYQKELASYRQKGFSRIRIDGEILDLSQNIELDKQKKHDIDVFIDRLVLRPMAPSTADPTGKGALRARLQDSVETALKLAEGLVAIQLEDGGTEHLFSDKFACVDCGVSYPLPEPRTFSFNSPIGACKKCNGLGYLGNDVEDEDDLLEDDSAETGPAILIRTVCTDCNGTRLKQSSLHFKVGNHNIADLCSLSIKKLASFFDTHSFTKREVLIADRILKEIKDRLSFLLKVGVDYLSLNRSAQTLSGGESQRIRLASQIGSSLNGVIYVLDEPSIGLHQRDNDRLIESLLRLRDMGNTVLVVEHDRDTIEKADHIIDLGPAAGTHGGDIIAQGSVQDIIANSSSITGRYLNDQAQIPVPKVRRTQTDPTRTIVLSEVAENNLKHVEATIPLGCFICVTGVSGSGKSSLVIDTLYPLLMQALYKSKIPTLRLKGATGLDKIDKVVDIDQSPIGRTPRSNPATYTGTFSLIRDLFSQLPESRARGFKSGRFSFNVKGGRCEKCRGDGLVRVEMHFLSDIYVRCDECEGKRYNNDTLSILYKGKSISNVLDMTIDDAMEFFSKVPLLKQKLKTLSEVGLGYITLGQSATTLSGGEAQRMKLAKELASRSTGNTFYILDEPTTGLHFDDVRKLNEVLHRLVEQGNTVLVIEHNLEVIKTADHVIDLGPEGGELGGEIVAIGTPEQIAQNPKSVTGRYLARYL